MLHVAGTTAKNKLGDWFLICLFVLLTVNFMDFYSHFYLDIQ